MTACLCLFKNTGVFLSKHKRLSLRTQASFTLKHRRLSLKTQACFSKNTGVF